MSLTAYFEPNLGKTFKIGLEMSNGNIDVTLTCSYVGRHHYNMDSSSTSSGTLVLMFPG